MKQVAILIIFLLFELLQKQLAIFLFFPLVLWLLQSRQLLLGLLFAIGVSYLYMANPGQAAVLPLIISLYHYLDLDTMVPTRYLPIIGLCIVYVVIINIQISLVNFLITVVITLLVSYMQQRFSQNFKVQKYVVA